VQPALADAILGIPEGIGPFAAVGDSTTIPPLPAAARRSAGRGQRGGRPHRHASPHRARHPVATRMMTLGSTSAPQLS
jgi:hypothetical protein